MEAVNSLLFILTTLAPNNVPFDDYPVTNSPLPEWNKNVFQAEILGEEDGMTPCEWDLPHTGERHCPPNEHYRRCGSLCSDVCTQIICPIDCCLEGCFCDKGYVRLSNGSCIKGDCFHGADEGNQIEDSLTSYAEKCGPDEYISCDSQCQRNCSNYRDNIVCPKICVLDCVCIPPKIRGPDGNCILPQQCVSTSLTRMDDDTKHWRAICNFLHIMNQKEPRCPMKEKQCNDPDECFHGDGESFLQIRTQVDDEREPCFPDLIPEGHMECPPGEHYERCGDVCLRSCIEYDCPLKCCVEGCFCAEGYVRGPNSDCIPKEKCREIDQLLSNEIEDMHDSHAPGTRECEPDETISCNSHCEKTCSNIHDVIPCPKICVLGCVCNLPKIRGPDGDCIFLEQCSLASSKLDLDFKRNILIRNFHRIRENAIQWVNAHSLKDKQCDNPFGCPGNNEEISIQSPQEQFLKCRKNAFPSLCPSTCPDTCDNYHDKSRTCKEICLPVPKCVCEEGFVRGPSGDCITPQECPIYSRGPEDCPVREYYNSCGPVCEDDCVSYIGFHFGDHPCLDKSCKAGCFCRPGLIRGNEGRCIWPFLCYIPSPEPYEGLINELSPFTDEYVCPENEEWQSCGTACPKNCTNYDKDIPCTENCSVGCFCKEPRVRGPGGKCILIEECPLASNAFCPENEEWRLCGTTCPKDCTNYDKKIRCVTLCTKGCYCKEPRVRGPDGTCILIEECPPRSSGRAVCPEGEYYDECNAHCQKNCTNYDQDISCTSACVGGCVCKPPMVRGPEHLCVDIEECTETVKEDSAKSDVTPVCPENEHFDDCGSRCPKNCTNYNKDSSCSRECVPGCFCEDPLVRGPNGDCIGVQECPMTPSEEEENEYNAHNTADLRQLEVRSCKENERYTLCKAVCPETCTSYIEDRSICKRLCLPGCECLPGYVISRNGVCVKQELCGEDRPEDCSELEVYNECGSHCEKDCFNKGHSTRECYTSACRKGCYCKPGWVRSRDMKCIPSYECRKMIFDLEKRLAARRS